MAIRIVFVMFLLLTAASAEAQMRGGAEDFSPVRYERADYTDAMRISRGGQLYDDWWRTTVHTRKPEADHPLWKRQNSNKRSGYATHRCKECHGWDYLGRDGAYGKGSHYTGFTGIYRASLRMTPAELEEVLRGSTDRAHDFSGYLDDNAISDLALFMKEGLVDLTELVNTAGLPVRGDAAAGRTVYTKHCMTECHGPEGMAINFGSADEPEFVGTIALGNPWEFIHKARAGQPGTRMTSGIMSAFTDQELRNLLAYARTLPVDRPEPGLFDRLMDAIGLGEGKRKSIIPEKQRGFGPKTEVMLTRY